MEKKKQTKSSRGDIISKIVVGLVGTAALLLLVLFIIALTMR
jgi:hypothetical protein